MLSIQAPTGRLSPDAPLEVHLTVLGATDLGGFEIDLESPAELVAITRVDTSEFLGSIEACNEATQRCAASLGPLVDGGRQALGAYSYGNAPGADGNGVLATLHFQPTGLHGLAELRILNPILVDTAGMTVIPLVQDAVLDFSWPYEIYLPVVEQ